jgi:hypothetical protein
MILYLNFVPVSRFIVSRRILVPLGSGIDLELGLF